MKTKICPICKSKKIGINSAGGNLTGLPSDYCKDCGFNDAKKGPVFMHSFSYLVKKRRGKNDS